MKLAIVHDWFIHVGGAERVLLKLHQMWPQAPLYFLIADTVKVRSYLPHATVRTSRLNRIPFATRIYPALAPLMPAATEAWDLSSYDVVISSSVLFSKGVIVRPHTRHISYCYSPPRMLWDRSDTYERRGIGSRLVRHGLRVWDTAASSRPDQIISLSQTVADRVKKYWNRDSIILPPSVPLPPHGLQRSEGNYFLIVARLVPHKNLEVAIDAFNKTKQVLVLVGEGPLYRRLARRAGPTVRLMGRQSDAQLAALYAGCRAVVVPNEEDFGLTAVEAMSHGKPVLALRAGGACETVIEGVTGEFFDDAIPEALADGIHRLCRNASRYHAHDIRNHSTSWSSEKFEKRFRALVAF